MPIQLKRSAVAGKVPTTAQLSLGELAVNTRDGRLFLKKDNGTEDIIEFVSSEILHGQVAYFAMTTAPTGWLKCNGAAISRTTYADLFAAIGTTFGVGNGSTTFNLPNLRGEFLRAWDDGAGVDAGRILGTFQGQSLQSHSHSFSGSTNTTGAHNHRIGYGMDDDINNNGFVGVVDGDNFWSTDVRTSWEGDHWHSFSGTTDASGAIETRPRNIALLACIKY